MRFMLLLGLLCAAILYTTADRNGAAAIDTPETKQPLSPLAESRLRATGLIATKIAGFNATLARESAAGGSSTVKCVCDGSGWYRPDGRVLARCPCAAAAGCKCRPAARGESPTPVTPDEELLPLPLLGPAETVTPPARVPPAVPPSLAPLFRSPLQDFAPFGGATLQLVPSPDPACPPPSDFSAEPIPADATPAAPAAPAVPVLPVAGYYCSANWCTPCRPTERWLRQLPKQGGNWVVDENYEDGGVANFFIVETVGDGKKTPKALQFHMSHRLVVYPTWLFMRGNEVVRRYDGDAASSLTREQVLAIMGELNAATAAADGAVSLGLLPGSWFVHDLPGSKPKVDAMLDLFRDVLGGRGTVSLTVQPESPTGTIVFPLSDKSGLRITSTPELATRMTFDGKKIQMDFVRGRVQAYWRGISGNIPGVTVDTDKILVPLDGAAPDQRINVLP